jgi:hypothetical protein
MTTLPKELKSMRRWLQKCGMQFKFSVSDDEDEVAQSDQDMFPEEIDGKECGHSSESNNDKNSGEETDRGRLLYVMSPAELEMTAVAFHSSNVKDTKNCFDEETNVKESGQCGESEDFTRPMSPFIVTTVSAAAAAVHSKNDSDTEERPPYSFRDSVDLSTDLQSESIITVIPETSSSSSEIEDDDPEKKGYLTEEEFYRKYNRASWEQPTPSQNEREEERRQQQLCGTKDPSGRKVQEEGTATEDPSDEDIYDEESVTEQEVAFVLEYANSQLKQAINTQTPFDCCKARKRGQRLYRQN